jgi:hypothetical protein
VVVIVHHPLPFGVALGLAHAFLLLDVVVFVVVSVSGCVPVKDVLPVVPDTVAEIEKWL